MSALVRLHSRMERLVDKKSSNASSSPHHPPADRHRGVEDSPLGNDDWSALAARAKGRGAFSNASGRFESQGVQPFDDGWDTLGLDTPPLSTQLLPETPRSAITYNKSPDISFDRTINPYRGCEHGCIYCYARPAHAYAGMSSGLDFETRIFVKDGLPQVLERELSRPRYRPRTLVLGGDTDVYQPAERSRLITRSVLEVLSHTRHPVALVTKSALVLRDLDILAPMAEQGLVRVAISLTSLDNRLSRKMEPRAAAPHRRLDTIRALSKAGIPVTVMTAPIIPAINDMAIDDLLQAASEAGASSAGYVLLRLPLEISTLFREWLDANYPDRASKVMRLMQDMRNGRDYQSEFGLRQRGSGAYARLISQRFRKACARYRLNQPRLNLRTDLFRPPLPGANNQGDLFQGA